METLTASVYGPPLAHSFYDRPTVEVAPDLLGRTLVYRSPAGVMAGVIVETEAYGPEDPANHAFRGLSKRNAHMFGPPGMAYIYRIYGMYWCLNAVTRPEGHGEAVLIRALEPIEGVELMEANRGMTDRRLLCKGPGRLCMALGLTGEMNGADLAEETLFITEKRQEQFDITVTTRIGLTKAADFPWRYYITGNPYISRK
jgi:DNA-3-methyladenine glycosylase